MRCVLRGCFVFISWILCVSASQSTWLVQSRPHHDHPIRLHIALSAVDGHAVLQRAADNIANPGHERFRKHLTQPELQALLAPPVSTVSAVSEWLRANDIDTSSIFQRGNLLEVPISIGQAEDLLHTTYFVYSDGFRDIIRTESYTLPRSVRHLIDFISPTTAFPEPAKLKPRDTTLDHKSPQRRDTCGSDDLTTTSCIRQIYNVTYTPEPNRTTFGVYATEASSFQPKDLHQYLQAYNAPAAQANAQYKVIGTGDPANGVPGIEGAFETALDTQTALSLAWPATGILYDLGGVFGPNPGETYDPFVRFLQDLLHNETVPSVVSFSESLAEDKMDKSYAESLCNMMSGIGARGVTLVFSSGNNGAQGDDPTQKHNATFEPKFPASCAWVLSVGGTTDMISETAATQQTVMGAINKASLTASGGGFSNYFARPKYQDAVVQNYIAAHVPQSYYNLSGFNASGRGYPDVSAFSTSFPVVYNGSTVGVAGTSAAAPTWAAILTLLNDYQASRGRSPLGFVNPWLYNLPTGTLKDITTGGNNSGACTANSSCTLSQTPGYVVSSDWDPVTGLGSPLFSRLIDALDAQALTGGNSTGAASLVSVHSVTWLLVPFALSLWM